ncbi:MAG: hypothetical protein ACO2PP_16665 [Thermocrinis sp.]|jgi:hypothetical protein|uniref:hypothetical protein n=1 Tax=Thermocrinis sp. TaxID=2024383 RepID=UPI003C10677E
MEYVIYAAYGSNLLTERLLTYIKGGKFRKLPKWHAGCPDKTEPVSLGWKRIPYRVYFGGYSDGWKGGVAFLSPEMEPDREYHAVVRLWKMKREQYKCVKSQEGTSYAKEINLGTLDGLEILTFTSEKKLNYNPPSKLYMDVLKEGLKETTGWTDEEIEKYWEKFLK